MQNEMHSRSYLVSGARNMLSLILRRASGHARIFKAQSRSNYQNVFFLYKSHEYFKSPSSKMSYSEMMINIPEFKAN